MVTFTPSAAFKKGETVVVNLTNKIMNAVSLPLIPKIYSFTVNTEPAQSFVTNSELNTGTQPRSIAVSDLDGNNYSDLIVVNEGSNTVSIVKNNGDGTFAEKNDYLTGSHPYSVYVADIDGDGDSDLAVANSWEASVSVYKNNGDGTFTVKTDYATGTSPYSVFITDIDGDGNADIVTANYAANNVSVLKNNGDGTFSAKADYPAGSGPISVFIADLDKDGDGDIVTANYTASSVSVLKNNGNGTFDTNVDYPAGNKTISVFISDLDGDGDGDIVAANSTANTVSVLKNNNDGTFSAKTDYTTGNNPYSVSIGDVDGDGDGDIVSTNYGSNSVSVMKNNGDGTFVTKTDYETGLSPFPLCIADLNNDGDLDIIVANTSYAYAPVCILAGGIVAQVTTQAVTNITPTKVTGNGNITSLGVPNPIHHGFCWSKNGIPTIANSKIVLGAVTGTGTFTAEIIGLEPNTNYYLRAYVQNNEGANYGEVQLFSTPKIDQTITFTTLAPVKYGTLPHLLTATGGGSGMPVVFSSSDDNIATCSGLNGETITFTGIGTCTIYANQQESFWYNAAPETSQILTVDKGELTITGGFGDHKSI